MYTTLSPCDMCTGACLLYGIARVVIGENRTFLGGEAYLRSRGVKVGVICEVSGEGGKPGGGNGEKEKGELWRMGEEARVLMESFIEEKPDVW